MFLCDKNYVGFQIKTNKKKQIENVTRKPIKAFIENKLLSLIF